tara:strand:+ start:252 stop:896 length:645 start_codon:yes stop_codon:yes gene_type:complete
MDEEISIIDTKTRNEKIINFFINNKKKIIKITSIILVLIFIFLSFDLIHKRNKIKLANQFNIATIDFEKNQKEKTVVELKNIINKHDTTYSPLALYFIIDNNLINSKDEINVLFDVLINKTNLKKEIKNLIIYKKGLYNAEFLNGNELIHILSPIINSESTWKPHALYLIGEFFYSKNEKIKSREFFEKILSLSVVNTDIKLQAQKRIQRDFSE